MLNTAEKIAETRAHTLGLEIAGLDSRAALALSGKLTRLVNGEAVTLTGSEGRVLMRLRDLIDAQTGVAFMRERPRRIVAAAERDDAEQAAASFEADRYSIETHPDTRRYGYRARAR